MPINGLTDRRRLHRVGKVRLGEKKRSKSNVEYPVAVDHYVVRSDTTTSLEAAVAFWEHYGEDPRKLDVVFPADDEERFADVNQKMYGGTWGKVCSGSGLNAQNAGIALAKWDMDQTGLRPEGTAEGTWANRKTKSWAYREVRCLGADCPMQQGTRPACKMVMTLQFLMPDVKGVGVWQLDTSSWNSVHNVRDSIETVKAITGGRIRGIPLELRLVPKEVVPPDGSTTKKTIYVLDLSLPDISINDLLREAAKLPEHGLLLPPPLDDEEPPDDLFPSAAVGFDPGEVDERTGEVLALEAGYELTKQVSVTNAGEFMTWALKEKGLRSQQTMEVLGITKITDIKDFQAAMKTIEEMVPIRQELPFEIPPDA